MATPTGKTPADQAEEQAKRDAARMAKTDEEKKEDRGKQGKITTGELKFKDIREQARQARKEKGKDEPKLTPAAVAAAPVEFKIGKHSGEQLYQGIITCTGVSWETGQTVSAQIEIPNPVTKEGVFYRFRQYHPSVKQEGFEIDTENVSDPLLRTSLEIPDRP
jgi:hypothetical protein